jgi:hypothetical protein
MRMFVEDLKGSASNRHAHDPRLYFVHLDSITAPYLVAQMAQVFSHIGGRAL